MVPRCFILPLRICTPTAANSAMPAMGTPTTNAFQQTLMALEGPACAGVGIAPSGLAAITTTLLAVLKAGDHVLVCDNVYPAHAQFL